MSGGLAIASNIITGTSITAGTTVASGTTVTAGTNVAATQDVTAGAAISAGTTVTAGTNIILGGNLLTDDPVVAVSLVDNNTTGDIGVGLSLTTGDVNLGNAASTGQVHVRNTGEDALQSSGGIVAAKLIHSTIGHSRTFSYVSQTSNFTTAVTLNAYCGVVTTQQANTSNNNSATFTVNNDKCTVLSIIKPWIFTYDGANIPTVIIQTISNGSFEMRVSSAGNGSLNDVMNIGFEIMNGYDTA